MTMLPIDKMPDDYVPRKHKDAGTTPTDDERQTAWENYQNLTAGRIKEVYEAFGYSLDSDTDEMIGERVLLQVGVETVQRGERQGQLRNIVTAIKPLPDDAPEGGGNKDEDDF